MMFVFVYTVDGDERRPTNRPESDEEQLLSELFCTYNKFARPLVNSSLTVVVTLQFSLMHIKDLVSYLRDFHTPTGLEIPSFYEHHPPMSVLARLSSNRQHLSSELPMGPFCVTRSNPTQYN